jgi:hypothetical protein
MVIRDWAYRNFKRRPVRASLALALVAAVSALSYAMWLYDVTVWDETDLWPIIDVPGE